MTSFTTNGTYTIHFLGALTIVDSPGFHGSARVTDFGDELVVTPELRELNTDINDDCFFDLADDEAGQRARWGQVLFREGPWPEGESRVQRGSVRWQDERDALIRSAWKIENEIERRCQLVEIAREYPAEKTSRTLAEYAGE